MQQMEILIKKKVGPAVDAVLAKEEVRLEKEILNIFFELNANNVCIGTHIITLLLQGGMFIIMISEGDDRQPASQHTAYGWAQVPKTWF